MGRPPLDPGTYGVIRTREMTSGCFEARCQFRHRNGEVSRPASRGPSRAAAERELKRKLAAVVNAATRGEVTRDTRLGRLADVWLEGVEADVAHGVLSSGTLSVYRSVVKQHIRPRLGALRIGGEVTVAACNDLIVDTRATHSYETAKSVRTVLSAVCAFAVRRGVLAVNPVRSTERLAAGRGDRRVVTALTVAQIGEMLAGLRAYAATRETDAKGRRLARRSVVWRDLAELAEAMLATGDRLGEVLALASEDVLKDDGHPAVRVDAHIVRETGKGLVRVPGRKGGKPGAVHRVPQWSAAMFARRKLAAGDGPLFAAWDGGWLDPSNTTKRIRAALDGAGFDWVTSHVWRHTVGTLLDAAGLSVAEVADQLGNTRAVAEKHYIKPRVTNAKGAAALEGIRPAVTR